MTMSAEQLALMLQQSQTMVDFLRQDLIRARERIAYLQQELDRNTAPDLFQDLSRDGGGRAIPMDEPEVLRDVLGDLVRVILNGSRSWRDHFNVDCAIKALNGTHAAYRYKAPTPPQGDNP